MSWKEWPSWLKGGVIGTIIFILLILFSLILSYLHSFFYNNGINSISFIIELLQIFIGTIGIYPIFFISNLTHLDKYLIGSGEPLLGLSMIGGIVGLLIYFITGAIIGALIGKFRK